jgi:hypothetical protein
MEQDTSIKTYRVIVGPNGEVFQPESCWIVDVTMWTETTLRADIDRENHLGDVLRGYGARDLKADLGVRQQCAREIEEMMRTSPDTAAFVSRLNAWLGDIERSAS